MGVTIARWKTIARRHFYALKLLHGVNLCTKLNLNDDTFAKRYFCTVLYFYDDIFPMKNFKQMVNFEQSFTFARSLIFFFLNTFLFVLSKID